jgi:hypothetical protein
METPWLGPYVTPDGRDTDLWLWHRGWFMVVWGPGLHVELPMYRVFSAGPGRAGARAASVHATSAHFRSTGYSLAQATGIIKGIEVGILRARAKGLIT